MPLRLLPLLLPAVLHGLPGVLPPPSSLRRTQAGLRRGVAAARVVFGPVPHLPVAAKERLHRARADGSPDVLLRLRPQAEEEEQAVPGVPAAHPVGGADLRLLRRNIYQSERSLVPLVWHAFALSIPLSVVH